MAQDFGTAYSAITIGSAQQSGQPHEMIIGHSEGRDMLAMIQPFGGGAYPPTTNQVSTAAVIAFVTYLLESLTDPAFPRSWGTGCS